MKTIKKIPLELIEVETVPNKMEFGKLYYSSKYGVANHLCPCGCNFPTPIRIKDNEWVIVNKQPLTISPSIQQRLGCKSHYIISNGNANIV